MIWSVSTLARSMGATRPLCTVNLSIGVSPSSPLAHVDEVPGDRRRCGHLRAHQVRAPARALPALEVPVRGRGGALAGLEPVGVHGEAHRATGLAPFEPG